MVQSDVVDVAAPRKARLTERRFDQTGPLNA